MTAHRKRRIASDEAHAWARNLRLRNPLAKLVLSMVTGYVDGNGICFVGIEALAEDTELSPDTVRKRLAWLEQIGAVARFPQFIDANGRRNSDGRGKRTSDEIRLLMDAEQAIIEARALGEETAENDAGSDESGPNNDPISPSPQQGPNQVQPSVGPRLAPGQPSDSSEGLESSEPEPEPEDSPQAPQGGPSDDQDDRQEASEREIDGWDEFKVSFEADGNPILRVSIAKGLFGALSADERKLVTTAAQGLIVQRGREKKPGVKPSAQTFIREIEAWPGYANLAPSPSPPPKPQVTLAAGSDEFRALALARAIARLPEFSADASGATFVGEIPAGAATFAAIATFNPGSHDVDQNDWTIAEKGTPRYVAWCERVREWLGFWPEDHRYWFDENDNIVPSAAEAYTAPGKIVPKAKNGLLMPPLEFPPAKHAQEKSRGPPHAA